MENPIKSLSTERDLVKVVNGMPRAELLRTSRKLSKGAWICVLQVVPTPTQSELQENVERGPEIGPPLTDPTVTPSG